MRRWLALGVGVVGVAWAPYLYTELARGKPRESQLMAATQVEALLAAAPANVSAGLAHPPILEPSAAPAQLEGSGAAPDPDAPGARQAAEELQPAAAARAPSADTRVGEPEAVPAPAATDSTRDDPAHVAAGPLQATADRIRTESARGPAGSARAVADPAQPAPDPTRPADPTRAAAEATRPADPTRAAAEATRPADPTRAAAEATRPADPTRAAADPTRSRADTARDPDRAARDGADPAEPVQRSPSRAVLLPRAFDAEPRDAAWASAQEPRVSQLLAATGLAPEELAEVLCRRSVCRVTFKAPQLADGVEAALAARARADFADLLLEKPDPRSEHPAVLYLLRPDQAPEAPAPD